MYRCTHTHKHSQADTCTDTLTYTHTHSRRTHTYIHTYTAHQVAELVGFWLLSLLQTPLILYSVINTDSHVLPLEMAVCIPLLLFLLAELGLGLRALCQIVNSQALKFHLSHSTAALTSDDDTVETERGREFIEMNQLS